MIRRALTLALLLTGCAGAADAPAPVPAFQGQLPMVAEVTYYTAPSSALNAAMVDDGAALLAKMGFGLVRVADKAQAQITLGVEDNHTGGCIDRSWDAYKQGCGEIYVCQRALDEGRVKPAMIAHEISHALGMPHVTGDAPALMGPYESPVVDDFTDADAAGFQSLRTIPGSVFSGYCLHQVGK
jgi:hypothetical protein